MRTWDSRKGSSLRPSRVRGCGRCAILWMGRRAILHSARERRRSGRTPGANRACCPAANALASSPSLSVAAGRPRCSVNPTAGRVMVQADARIRLLLLFGGRSCEHEVSVTSAKSVLAAVDRARYDLTLVGIGKNGRWMLCDDPSAVFAAGFVGDDAGLPVTLDYSDGGRLLSPSEP